MGDAYSRVLRYNFSPDELYALIDVIGMIKGLGGLLKNSELLVLPVALRYIHDTFQAFLQESTAHPLRRAHKRKKTNVKNVMLNMRNIGSDYLDGATADDSDYKKMNKKQLLNVVRKYPMRFLPPTHSQIALIRRMCHSIFSPRSSGMQVCNDSSCVLIHSRVCVS